MRACPGGCAVLARWWLPAANPCHARPAKCCASHMRYVGRACGEQSGSDHCDGSRAHSDRRDGSRVCTVATAVTVAERVATAVTVADMCRIYAEYIITQCTAVVALLSLCTDLYRRSGLGSCCSRLVDRSPTAHPEPRTRCVPPIRRN